MTEDEHITLRAEIDRLRQCERQWRDRATAAADWYWEADAEGRFTAISEEVREFGIDPTRLIGLDRLTATDRDADIARRRVVLARKAPFRDLTCDYDWEGFPLLVALHGVPVYDTNGGFRGYRGCARDMTGVSPARASKPVMQLPRQPLASIEVPAPTTTTRTLPDDTHRRLRILVVDDDAVNRLVIGGFLIPHGHMVTFAHDGEQGVAQARDQRFDLVLMDVMMPGLDGPSATRIIRTLPPPMAAIPIIALTANAMPGDRERYLAEGMTDYVTKPINRDVLFTTIERVVGCPAFAPVAERQPGTPAPDASQAALLDTLADSLDL